MRICANLHRESRRGLSVMRLDFMSHAVFSLFSLTLIINPQCYHQSKEVCTASHWPHALSSGYPSNASTITYKECERMTAVPKVLRHVIVHSWYKTVSLFDDSVFQMQMILLDIFGGVNWFLIKPNCHILFSMNQTYSILFEILPFHFQICFLCRNENFALCPPIIKKQ